MLDWNNNINEIDSYHHFLMHHIQKSHQIDAISIYCISPLERSLHLITNIKNKTLHHFKIQFNFLFFSLGSFARDLLNFKSWTAAGKSTWLLRLERQKAAGILINLRRNFSCCITAAVAWHSCIDHILLLSMSNMHFFCPVWLNHLAVDWHEDMRLIVSAAS